MNIVLNCVGMRAGGGRADALMLIDSLPRLYKQHRFLAVVPPAVGYETLDVADNCEKHFSGSRMLNEIWRLWFDNSRLPKLAHQFEAQTMLSLGNLGPARLRGIRHVLMLRQAHFAYPVRTLRERGLNPSLRTRLMRRYFGQVVQTADALITQTGTIRDLVQQTYQIPCPTYVVPKSLPRRPEGKDDDITPKGQRQAERVRGATGFKLLYVSRYYPHKNIEAACAGVDAARQSGIDATLFLTIEPEDHQRSRRLLKRIRRGEYSGVETLGRVDVGDLALVYRATDAAIITSNLESFSATYLEAMAFAKPVLAVDREYAREICGEAALYFAPGKIEAIAQAIQRAAADPDLRHQLIAAGQRRYTELDVPPYILAERYMSILSGESTDGTPQAPSSQP